MLLYEYPPLFQAQETVVRIQISGMQLEGHVEADSMLMALTHILSKAGENLVWRCDDTDVLVDGLYHESQSHFPGTVFMDRGLSGKNNRRMINVRQLAANLTHTVSSNL